MRYVNLKILALNDFQVELPQMKQNKNPKYKLLNLQRREELSSCEWSFPLPIIFIIFWRSYTLSSIVWNSNQRSNNVGRTNQSSSLEQFRRGYWSPSVSWYISSIRECYVCQDTYFVCDVRRYSCNEKIYFHKYTSNQQWFLSFINFFHRSCFKLIWKQVHMV